MTLMLTLVAVLIVGFAIAGAYASIADGIFKTRDLSWSGAKTIICVVEVDGADSHPLPRGLHRSTCPRGQRTDRWPTS
jgi:hypothetical protein